MQQRSYVQPPIDMNQIQQRQYQFQRLQQQQQPQHAQETMIPTTMAHMPSNPSTYRTGTEWKNDTQNRQIVIEKVAKVLKEVSSENKDYNYFLDIARRFEEKTLKESETRV